MKTFIDKLISSNEIKIIEQETDVELEISHIAYLEIKKENSKALLFTNPINKRLNQKFDIPVLINLYGSKSRMDMVFGKSVKAVEKDVSSLLKFQKPSSLKEKFLSLQRILQLRFVLPKTCKKNAPCQEIISKDPSSLKDLPILKTWDLDGGAFITMGQVYTQSLNGKMKNLGMYRLQVFSDNTLGLHWQIHKDSTAFFNEYKQTGRKMPISIAIGGDPLYTWCATAPMPKGMFELMLYGFIRKTRPKMAKCVSNELSVPFDADIVIEGFADPTKFKQEGPFGDHTGYYTPIEDYPFLEITAITRKKSPIFLATVVGKPPIEDKYMGYPTERIFLPMLQTTAPDLLDYRLPENGVFHNLVLCQISPRYKAHSKQLMHTLWGVGQMSFCKHAIFVDKSVDLYDNKALTEHILNRLDEKSILVSSGILDALDHSSFEELYGGKLGIDACKEIVPKTTEVLADEHLLELFKSINSDVLELRQIFTNTSNPICLVMVQKTFKISQLFESLSPLKKHLKIVVVLDDNNNDLHNLYMTIWRVTNNFDSATDFFDNGFWGLDATTKTKEIDGFTRQWPKDVDCNLEVLNSLKQRKLVDFDDEFLNKWQLVAKRG